MADDAPSVSHPLQPGPLRDGDLELVLTAFHPADPARGFVPDYFFHMRHAETGAEMGHISLRVGDVPQLVLYSGHVGYGVHEAYRGNRYAERSCRLLLPFAARCGVRDLWITCNPDNIPSRRTLERLGGEMVEVVDVPPDNALHLRGDRQKCRFLFRLAPGDEELKDATTP